MKSGDIVLRGFSIWLRGIVFSVLAPTTILLFKRLVKGVPAGNAFILSYKGDFMIILEQLAHAFTSHLTMIVCSIALVVISQSILEVYATLARESAKAVHRFTYTSAMGETITVDSSKPLEVVQLRGLISTCNAQSNQFSHVEKSLAKNFKDRNA
jgi:hypothetical protein